MKQVDDNLIDSIVDVLIIILFVAIIFLGVADILFTEW